MIFAADHKADDLGIRLGASLVGGDVAAISKHGALVGKLRDLMHAVRDVEKCQSLRAEPPQDRENLRNVGGCQRRRRFIEDENAGLSRKRLGDLHHLAAGERQVLDQRRQDECLPPRPASAASAMRRCALRSIMPKRFGGSEMDDVVRHAEFGDQGELLKDAGNPA